MYTKSRILACTVLVLALTTSAAAGLMDFSDLDPGLPLDQQWAMPVNYSTGLPVGITATWTGWMAKNAAGPDDHTPGNDDHMQAFGAGSIASITFSSPLIIEEIWMHKTSWGDTGDWTVVGLLAGVEQWSSTITTPDVWTSVQDGAGIPIDELSFPQQSQWNHIDDITTELTEYDNARNPIPADGALARPTVFGSNVYMMLDYTPGTSAVTSTAYFSDNEQDVIDRDPAHSLGEAPIWPAMSDTAFVVGYDDSAIVEFARTPLVRGTTYYWCIDTFDGADTWFGEVWSFTVMPEKAWNPSPPDGAEDIGTDPNLTVSWNQGDVVTEQTSISYDVYYGTDPVAVAAATTPNQNVSVTSAEIGPLAAETVYAWRIDTVIRKTAPPFPVTTIEGDVWQFETMVHIPITDPNLKGWWRFDDDTFDWSGHGNHGTLNGPPVWSAGHVGTGSLEFSGTDFVEVPHDESLTVDSEVTVMAWINAQRHNSAGGDWQGILAKSNNPRSYSLYTYVEGTLHFSTTSEGAYVGSNSTATVPLNEWVHVCAMVVGGAHRYYINGGFAGEAGSGIVLSAADTATVRIGMTQEGNNGFLGMIDDARIYDKALSEKEVAVIAGLLSATNPDPPDGATDVPRTPTLTFSPGPFAAAVNGSELYFSEDRAAVENRTATKNTLTDPTYAVPGLLDMGTTFYWVVDTVNGVDTWPGDLWSFTTVNWIPVDDMESYTPWTSPGDNIFEAWRDGVGNCAPGNGNDTGSTLTENPDPPGPVFGGIQSMKYEFDNDGMVYSPCSMTQTTRAHKYSRIEAQTATLPSGIGSDWTIEGVKALSISFHGQTGNATTESLWVQLKDNTKGYGDKVFYGTFAGESLDDFNEASWHNWNIDLNDLNVDLTNVVSIVIGIGDEDKDTAFGSGTLFFDEIRLYTPRCIPQRAKPAGDFDNSCQVDYPDVAAMFDDWLAKDVPEVAWDGTWQSANIGDVNEPGAFADLGSGAYSITADGADIWLQADAFRYAFQQISGDAQLTVRVTGISGPSTNDWRKAGVMIRETLDPNSPHAFIAITPAGGGGEAFQWRPVKGENSLSSHTTTGVTPPTCVRIVRIGDAFRGYYYRDGAWIQEGSAVTIPMTENVYIGMAVTSHDINNLCTATFDRACPDQFLATDLFDDKIINFIDYANLMNQWLDTVYWP